MRKVTAIRAGRGRAKRVNVFLDGQFAFSLNAEVAVKENLQLAAARYLSYRPRSESELRERLSQRGFGKDTVESVIARLRKQGLVDDAAFAKFWKDHRQYFNPRSRWLTSLELGQKGVAREIIDQAIEAVDDEDTAYRAALSKARALSRCDYKDFRRRLGGYLQRRGFNYQVIGRTVNLIWQENEGGQDSI
jgi:regulatory protein